MEFGRIIINSKFVNYLIRHNFRRINVVNLYIIEFITLNKAASGAILLVVILNRGE